MDLEYAPYKKRLDSMYDLDAVKVGEKLQEVGKKFTKLEL